MAAAKFPTTLLFSPNFVITAGAVLFRRSTSSSSSSPPNVLEVCILYHETKGHWLLAKGRKDRGESVEDAAIRETFEETGYPCRLMSGLQMWTRAPPPGSQTKDSAALVSNAIEPFAVTMRTVGPTNVKFTWWYIAEWTGEPKQDGTQTLSESFTSEFVSVDTALKRLTFETDREVVEKAAKIVLESDHAKLSYVSLSSPSMILFLNLLCFKQKWKWNHVEELELVLFFFPDNLDFSFSLLPK
ncbi:hypothetical protein Clacol_004501 [Clathrus columnatus]|uniref:Nudix hydrolase domain-containing protein n=1 Tax=Clathrus columnatus TaxID=1419009 RepID=A0AAV5A7L7_9AGAM|nr:hypothetical protein Clacol_004501 [Clathrus columnatus]